MDEFKNKKYNSYFLKGLVILNFILLVSCQSIPRADRSTMTMGFAEAAFGLGIESKGKHAVIRSDKLRRWKVDEPVYLSIKGEPQGTKLHNKIIRDLQELYRLAAIELKLDAGSAKQLIRVEVSDKTLLDMDKIITQCYTSYDNILEGYLKTIDIVATRNSLLDKDSNCLIHEGMHSLGFGGHPHRLVSVLSYTEDLRKLSDTDKALIKILYSEKMKVEMSVGEVLTVVYSELSQIPEKKEKRYVPRDMSLEVRQDETPLLLKAPFLEDARKRFIYKQFKNGRISVGANYGIAGSGDRFADLGHTKLSSRHIYRTQSKPMQFAKDHEQYLGLVTERSRGYVNHPLGNFRYAVADTPKYSCVFTIKYLDADSDEHGGHQVIHGSYCSNITDPLNDEDAQLFISSIDVLERNPVKMRERKIALNKNKQQNFSALRLTGKWPTNDSFISGLKLIIQGDSSGPIRVNVEDEICEGMLTKIATNGLGKWTLECESHENAEGRYSWDSDGTFSFRGETLTTNQDITWKGYQVF